MRARTSRWAVLGVLAATAAGCEDKPAAALPATVTPPGPPGMPGGMGMPGFQPPKPGELMPGMFRDQLKLTDDQQKQLAALQDETDKKLDAILTPEQREQWKKLREGGGMPPMMGMGPGGPPGGKK